MKTYRIEYKEILRYEFYVDAKSKEQAENKFRKMVGDGEINFDDGWVEYSDIESIKEDM